MKNLLFLFLIPILCFSQFPEGFENDVFPPTGWTSYIGLNGLGDTQNWKESLVSNNGDKSAHVRYEIKVTDVLGREINEFAKDIILIYLFDDGSIERVYNKQ